MIDRDLAELYGVETKVINQAVKRNIERFPEEFRFQLTAEENEFLRSQIATIDKRTETRGGRQYLPYVFTEQGVAMLSAVLHSPTAIQVSIKIMEAFVKLRHYVSSQIVKTDDKAELAEESNQSVDNVVNHILADFFAEHLELSQLNAETLLKTGEKCPCILLLENGKPIARVKMIVWGDGNLVFTSEKSPPKKHSGNEHSEPVANCDQFSWEAAKKAGTTETA